MKINQMISSLLFLFSGSIAICWSLPFIIFTFCGLQFYKVRGQKLDTMLKKLNKRSSISSDGDLEGWIIGYPYVGYIQVETNHHGGEKKNLYILTTRTFYKTISEELDNKDKDKKNNIVLWERDGNYFHLWWTKRNFQATSVEARPNQIETITEMLNFYDKNAYCVAFLHGPPGSGKSMIPLLLARTMQSPTVKVNFVDTFKPIDPGDSFGKLYNSVNPSKESPLIVVLEEFDGTLRNIHDNRIERHKHIPIEITDKTSWNQFMDRFDRKYYPHVILVLTSNMPPEAINAMDPSYIRAGRVNVTVKVE